ncbi:MAG: small conductance mechanosensitive channel, partial [Verrucomicrobiales bacterium]
FRIKDMVDINGSHGKVVRLTSSETVLMTVDGNHIRIPNADVFKGKIINYTRNPERRFDVVVGVGTDEDLGRAEEVGLKTLREMPGVLQDPPPTCLVDELGDSNVALRFHGWINQSASDFNKVRSHATRLIKVVFDSEEIGMPNPTYELNLRRPPQTAKSAVGESAPKNDTKRPTAEIVEKASRVDVSPDDHIDRQIDHEKRSTDEEDLLQEEPS